MKKLYYLFMALLLRQQPEVPTSTINGIFTDAAATASACMFTAPNTFASSGALPAGSQTLYAKITSSGGGCFYVVPFTYVMAANPPTFSTQPVSVSLFTGVAASNASSYQWQLSTNVTTITLTISNITGLNGNQYRCVATGAGGNTNSNVATLSVSPTTLILVSPADDINTHAGTRQASQILTATNRRTVPADLPGGQSHYTQPRI